MIKYYLLSLIWIVFPLKFLKSNEKDILYITIHYLPALAHTMTEEGCFTYINDYDLVKDTIIYDYDLIDKINLQIKKIEHLETNNNSKVWCDIRLTVVILYNDQTYDYICISGANYKEACILYNGVMVKPNPDLVWLVFNLVYDINEPLYRRILYDNKGN